MGEGEDERGGLEQGGGRRGGKGPGGVEGERRGGGKVYSYAFPSYTTQCADSWKEVVLVEEGSGVLIEYTYMCVHTNSQGQSVTQNWRASV